MSIKIFKRLVVAASALLATPSYAAETWLCDYENFQHTDRQQSGFHVEGGHLIENSGDVIVEYQLLEDSPTALVAAKGSSYASTPKVMAFLLMIEKETGDFVQTTASIGDINGRQVGRCKIATD